MSYVSWVKPGEIWQSCDRREQGRQVRILRVDETHAHCIGVQSARKSSIRLTAFHHPENPSRHRRGWQRVAGSWLTREGGDDAC